MNTTNPAPADYKDTLNLPKTTFDMKANLITREPAMLKQWQEQGLYQKIRGREHPKGKWVLHDGPPYANGDIHMGHLINKVLKDIVVKFRTLEGHDSPYVPGWDCHGLPIESAIQKELGPKMRELSKEAIRKKCHDYAMKYVGIQGNSFQRLGVFGEFNRPYLTLDPKYEGGILDVLTELVKKDLVYRQKKPVHWCLADRTALAEAELEYADRKDNSIFVSFTTNNDISRWPEEWLRWAIVENRTILHRFSSELMIWTTTPWTLPANRAIAIHPEHKYVCVLYRESIPDSEKLLVHGVVIAEKLVESVMKHRGISDYKISTPVTGAEFLARPQAYFHPLDPSRSQPVVLANYVTLEDGTGLVHTAPGHGAEDYLTGKRENLEIYCPVLGDGTYDDTVPEFLRGQSIWDGNKLVLEKLKETGALFHHSEFNHSYPHCWRCKKPTIFRATEQWFVRASGVGESPLWNNAKKYIDEVQWIPAWGKNRIAGMLDTRPDWCISRQRTWGVPIPAFFDAKGNVVFNEKTVKQIANHFRQHGADKWYTQSPAQLLGLTPGQEAQGLQSLGLSADLDVNALEKGHDILDVWFESGASHHAVLEGTHPELGYPAAMYLEGSDQHRGWFQASLLEASGYKSEPPFKQVLTHGFLVDGNGRKMSKSEGNDIKVEAALKEYGADVLRLWALSVDYQNDITCSKDLFARTADAYRKIRNTIRYLLGNLYDFDPTQHSVEPRKHSIDQWMHQRANAVFAEVWDGYDQYEFHRVFKAIYEFCNVDISAIYAKAIKDRLYCDLPNSPRRRASQTVCYRILWQMVQLLSPVLVFTAEEAWAAIRALPGGEKLPASVHLAIAEKPTEAKDEETAAHWSLLMPLIDKGLKELDDMKKRIGLGNALDAEAVIIVPAGDGVAELMSEYGPEIEDALGVGYHRVEHGAIWDITIHDTRNTYPSCARSWKRRPDVGSDATYPDLSKRDAAVVKALRGA